MLDEDKVARLSLVDAVTHHCSVKLRPSSHGDSSEMVNSHDPAESSAREGSTEQHKEEGEYIQMCRRAIWESNS